MIELPLVQFSAEIDQEDWAQALAPYVAALLQPAQVGVFRSVHHESIAPIADGMLAGQAGFNPAPGFSISRILQAGSRVMLMVRGVIGLDFPTSLDGDIGRLTLWRSIDGGQNWLDLTPPGCGELTVVRPSTRNEVLPFAIDAHDVPGLTEPTAVQYQLAVRSANGTIWLGRRYDTSMAAPTTFTMLEM